MQITGDELVIHESEVWTGRRYIIADTIKCKKHKQELSVYQAEKSWNMSRVIGKLKLNKNRNHSKIKKKKKESEKYYTKEDVN